MLAVVCDSYCKEKESNRDVKCDKTTVLFFEWCLWYIVSVRQNLTKGALNDWALIICMFVSYGGTGTSKLSIAVNCVQSSASGGVKCTVAEVVIQTARTHGWVLASNGGVWSGLGTMVKMWRWLDMSIHVLVAIMYGPMYLYLSQITSLISMQ